MAIIGFFPPHSPVTQEKARMAASAAAAGQPRRRCMMRKTIFKISPLDPSLSWKSARGKTTLKSPFLPWSGD